MKSQTAGIGFFGLAAMVVGTMIGGGAFNLPGAMAQGAGVGSVLIGWSITGLGMIMLAFVFQFLANARPELDGGIYAYAKEGFGRFIGFNSGWGYWMSAWIGTVANITLIFSTLSYFFPIFSAEHRTFRLVMSALLIWGLFWLIRRGMREAALLNIVTTIAKLVPLFLFIILILFAFRLETFRFDFWGEEGFSWSHVFPQVKSTMLVTLWAFVGIEGAVVLSSRARHKRDVGRATVIGLVGTLLIYMMISIFSFGVMTQAQLAALPEPSMAYVLEAVVGPVGATFINIGLLVSLGGALLGWTILATEISYVASRDGVFPRVFNRLNRNETPVNALLITQLFTQVVTVIALFSEQTYLVLSSIAGIAALVPYLFSALFGWKEARRMRSQRMLVVSGIASLYAAWLLYASGMEYVLIAMILYAPGIFVFIVAEREQGRPFLSRMQYAIAVLILLAATYGVYGLWTAAITL
ncbi:MULTISPECIES: basic amino acid/polyamine antiporter [Exiguobacterium]|uniref:basic amino acid/polyamine antiporter n=1 Tax=Exiguobacterium TaxID=33986 RepID=UPI001BE92009|nr:MULTISPECIES: basic amino acid/polyamine antiporter [Exiguobacterium]MCT4783205.1 basic amino acid/polyamine antiporter [Exiguobacterium himgiriensis]